MNPTQQPTVNRINPMDKTADQRKDELELILADASSVDVPESIKLNAKMIDSKDIKLGNTVLRNLGDCFPRAWLSKTGKRAGETSYTLFDNRYDPIIIKGKDNTKLYIRISIVSF